MKYYLIKLIISSRIIVLVSEISKRSSFFGAILESIPIITVLSMIWLYIDTEDIDRIKNFLNNIFLMVIPSLVLLISLPFLINIGLNFWPSLAIPICFTVIFYILTILILSNYGTNLCE